MATLGLVLFLPAVLLGMALSLAYWFSGRYWLLFSAALSLLLSLLGLVWVLA